MSVDYDLRSATSIEKFAQGLVGKTLGEIIGPACVTYFRPGKGGLGQLLEDYYFKIHPGNLSRPDFDEAGVELKILPLIKRKKGDSAKERMVLSIINYEKVAEEEWANNSFLKKNGHLLIMGYHWRPNTHHCDMRFAFAKLWRFPENDLPHIKADWEKIHGRIKAGEAHLLSEADTMFLGACTKGATAESSYRAQPNSKVLAKQRAFSLKASYVNRAILGLGTDTASLLDVAAPSGLERKILEKFVPFVGKTPGDIARMLGVPMVGGKASNAILVRRMLGIKKSHIDEFETGDVLVKTIRLQMNGRAKESMSFPAFRFKELIKEEWDTSTLREILEKKFLFVVWQFEKGKVLRFRGAKFWVMPQETLEGDVKSVWERTVELVKQSKCDDLPKEKDEDCCHVRPHGQRKSDTDEAPDGTMFTKKCFWLNAGFVSEQVAELAKRDL